MSRTARALLLLASAILLRCGGSGDEAGSKDALGPTGDGATTDARTDDARAVPEDAALDDAAALPDVPAAPDVPLPRDIPLPRPDVPRGDGWSGSPHCDPCGYGSIRGRVCAPNEQVFVNGASIWVEAYACDGTPVTVETRSDGSGYYLLEDVPCGTHVVHIRKGSYEHGVTVSVQASELNDITAMGYKLCFAPTAARLAVITGDWDNIEDLLRRLGLDADVYELYGSTFGDDGDWTTGEAYDLLSDAAALANYDIVFVDCGEAHWEMSNDPSVRTNLKDFVENGGSLYMSDWAYIYSERLWPDAIDYNGGADDGAPYSSGAPTVMNSDRLTGIVLDQEMKEYLGAASLPIELGLSPLVSVLGGLGSTTMHVVAAVPQFDNQNQPLILSFRPTLRSGRVVYTTFHNTEQAMAQMQKVLEFLVFVL